MAAVFSSFLKLFIVASPPSAVAVLLALTARHSDGERMRAASISCAVAFSVLICVALTGPLIFDFFGVSLQAFKVAGGLFLVYVGVGTISGSGGGEMEKSGSSKPPDIFSFAITPLGVPLICGPGMISTVLLFGLDMAGISGRLSLCLSLVLTFALLYSILLLCSKFASKIPPFALDLASKLTGVFILSLGSSIVLSGISVFLQRGAAA
ncbi:MAG: MarC family protein [Puniceicoccales bacterium]|jgi:multiple antibiotic resistance protein|nr:MarC family protein [Puniceicoccales bacterium]